MMTNPTPQEIAKYQALDALRDRMRQAQIDKANAHNARKHGHVQCSCGQILHNIHNTERVGK